MQRVMTFCDVCAQEGEDRPADVLGHQLSNNGTTIVVDLCKEDMTELSTALEPFFTSGRKPDLMDPVPALRKRRQTTGEFACPECGRVFTTKQGVITHSSYKHTPKTPTTRDGARDTGDWYCEEEGCTRHFETQQGIKMHALREHRNQRLPATV